MNASCALQHFCDTHGPQTLLCTDTRSYIHDVNDTDEEDLKTFYSQYIKSEKSQGKTECKSCTLSPEGILVSTIDSSNHMVYISSPSTPNQDLFKTIRNACVRSLNIEKPADDNSPIFFGDDQSGYCLSLAFICKDFNARGSQRLYSLCYLSPDKYHLISLLNFLTKSLRQIVQWLQADANDTYEQEGRIKINTNLNSSSAAAVTYIYRTPPNTPSLRMLSDIVHDSKITYRVHALFVWLLRTANLAIHESLFDALPTEEETTRQERRDIFDTEEMVMRRRTATIVLQPQSESVVMSATLTNTHHPNYLSSSVYSTNETFQQSDNGFAHEEDFDSLEYHFASYGHEALRLFQLFVKKLNNTKYLQYILHHWTIGDRLILKYTNRIDNKDPIRELVSVFRLFLPDGCFQLLEASNQATSCTANMILLDTDSVLTNEMLLSITENPSENNTIIVKIILDDIDESLRVVKLETPPPPKTDAPVPLYVNALLDLLTDTQLNEEIFQSIIEQNKIKYLNKAKLHFQFGRCQGSMRSSINDGQQIKIFRLGNLTDLALIRFWQKGLSKAYRDQIYSLKQDHNQQQRPS